MIECINRSHLKAHAMTNSRVKYEDKFVAFIDILGFKGLVEESAANDDPSSIVRIIERLWTENDRLLYSEYGAEICPNSQRDSKNLSFCITQISDCVIVSAEISPAGAINIVNYCRKIAERLLLREGVLCQGYLAMGKVCHQGTIIFGPAYQEAVNEEKEAAAIEWIDGSLGTPFIEVNQAISSYIEEAGDECIHKQFSRMTIPYAKYRLISPYGIFTRMIDWVISGNNTPEQMHREVQSARDIIDTLDKSLIASKPINGRAREKIRISCEKLSDARNYLTEADETIDVLASPLPTS